jgi:hypothetical protein
MKRKKFPMIYTNGLPPKSFDEQPAETATADQDSTDTPPKKPAAAEVTDKPETTAGGVAK